MTDNHEITYCSFCRDPAVYQHEDLGFVSRSEFKPEALGICRECQQKCAEREGWDCDA